MFPPSLFCRHFYSVRFILFHYNVLASLGDSSTQVFRLSFFLTNFVKFLRVVDLFCGVLFFNNDFVALYLGINESTYQGGIEHWVLPIYDGCQINVVSNWQLSSPKWFVTLLRKRVYLSMFN